MARAEHYFMLVDCCLDIICFVASLTMKNCHLVVKMQPSAPFTSGSGVEPLYHYVTDMLLLNVK